MRGLTMCPGQSGAGITTTRMWFGEPLHWAPPPISCFADNTLLDELPADARRFFAGFVEAATPFWKAEAAVV